MLNISKKAKPNLVIFILIFCFIFDSYSATVKHTLLTKYFHADSLKPSAQVYKGLTIINSGSKVKQKPSRIEYFISFSRYEEGCDYKNCFYGWVDNYTKSGEETVPGYPKDTDSVFLFKANSKEEYVIERNPKLQDVFANIIEVSCELYQPTLQQDLERSTDSKYENYKFMQLSQYQKLNPESSIARDPAKWQSALAASINVPLEIKDVEAKVSELKEQIVISKEYKIWRRNKFIDLNLPSDTLGEEKEKADFVSKINVRFDKINQQETDQEYLRKITQGLKQFGGQQTLTYRDIEKRRSDFNFYKQDLKFEDKLRQTADIFTIQETRLDLSRSLQKTASPCQLTNSPSAEIPIWSYQKVIVDKTIFGKKLLITIKIQAAIVNSNNIRFKGTMIYSLFGATKSVQIFNYVKAVNLAWSKNYSISGSYGASIYIPLPPPVSFLGINFSFTVSFSLSVTIYAKTDAQIQNCVFKFEVGADVGTSVGVGASAAVRAVAIEGGVFIKGTLVNLSTDPKLAIAYNLQTKTVVPTISWYLYIKAFKFEWGFFYRYWSPFSWSGKKIISKWPISNGITQTILIYKT